MTALDFAYAQMWEVSSIQGGLEPFLCHSVRFFQSAIWRILWLQDLRRCLRDFWNAHKRSKPQEEKSK